MAIYFRKRSTLHLPLTLSVSLMVLNVGLMICWILLLAQQRSWSTMTVGIVAFTLILAGLLFWLVLTIKEIRLNHRQANFVDSITHELKSPIAALQLYLETLRLRQLDDAKRDEFHAVMAMELQRLDKLISQLLEVGRLDELGQNELPENMRLDTLIHRCAESACVLRKLNEAEVFTYEMPEVMMHGRRLIFELIFSNLIDNAVKYGGDPPRVHLQVTPKKDTVAVRIESNGQRIAYEDRKQIFRIFYRGGSELERRQKGTGLGLYIVHTLVRRLRGKVHVSNRPDGQTGCVFEVELPGLLPVESSARVTAQV